MAAEQDNIIEHTVVQRRDPLLGGVFDRRFRIETKIAMGGFGAIYRATHLKSGHRFALKVLHPNLTTDPGVIARFRREGAALTLLRDPHTITAYELGEADDGTLYIVMELLRGESLYERYRARGPMPWQRVIAISRAVCSSLAEAHALGIIHRDLKPTNIHLEPRGNEHDFVKVLDFGIAKILQDSDIDSSDLTQAGQTIGTLDYMSPEQLVGGMCTATSDIYTLGIVMYEMISGCKPYDNTNSAAAALAAVLTTTPEPLSTRALVPPEVERVVMRCLERQPADRWQTAVELATALDEILPWADEVVTRVALGIPRTIPAVPDAAPGFSSTLPGVSSPVPRSPQAPPGAPPVARNAGPADSNADPAARTSPDSTTHPVASKRELAGPKPTPVPIPTPDSYDSTRLGRSPAERAAAAARSRQRGTPPVGTPPVLTKHLRKTDPALHHRPTSPTRPPASRLHDRPASSVGGIAPFDTARAVRRGAVRRLALAIGLAIAAIVTLLVTSQL